MKDLGRIRRLFYRGGVSLSRYFDFYNRRRPHSTLDGQTPDTAYFNQPLLAAAA